MVFQRTGCAVVLGRRCWGIPSLWAWGCTAAVVAAGVEAAAVAAAAYSPNGPSGAEQGRRSD